MRFTGVAVTSLLAAATSAGPSSLRARDSPIADGTPFNLRSISSGSELEHLSVSAARAGLLLELPSQNATCPSTPPQNYATFVMNNGSLFLYSDELLQVYSDRSGMGQGVTQYTNNLNSLPRNAQLTGWVVGNDSYLTFDGYGWAACPGAIDGAWSLWVDKPSVIEGCVGIALEAAAATDPQRCTYTISA